MVSTNENVVEPKLLEGGVGVLWLVSLKGHGCSRWVIIKALRECQEPPIFVTTISTHEKMFENFRDQKLVEGKVIKFCACVLFRCVYV